MKMEVRPLKNISVIQSTGSSGFSYTIGKIEKHNRDRIVLKEKEAIFVVQELIGFLANDIVFVKKPRNYWR